MPTNFDPVNESSLWPASCIARDKAGAVKEVSVLRVSAVIIIDSNLFTLLAVYI